MSIEAELLNPEDLTHREGSVFLLLCRGFCDKAIAKELSISVETVRVHLDRVYLKLGVREARLNARCASMAAAIARGMVRVSVSMLCALLLVQQVSFDGAQALRPGAAKVRVRRES